MKQYLEWAEFYRLEPWGFNIEDARLGILAAVIAKSQGAKHVEPHHFMMGNPAEDDSEPSPEEVTDRLKALLGAQPVPPKEG